MSCILKRGGGLYSRLAVGAVLLAAGEARRMGGRPKPLLRLAGVPLIRRNLFALAGAGVDEVVVVLGHRADEIEPVVRDFPITLVHNPDYAQGQASSVRAGLAALSSGLDAIVVALSDMPLITAEDFSALLGAYKRRTHGSVLVPFVHGERANPVVLDASLRDEVLAGDLNFGCRQWIERHPDRVVRFDVDSDHYLADLDSPEDLSQFERRYGHTLRWPTEVAEVPDAQSDSHEDAEQAQSHGRRAA
jgi:CTP:molybdopterin cytidylyltransferase MocA